MTARKPEGNKVRYAVVGAGWISQAAFMPGVEASGNSEMTAIVTADQKKAEALGRRYKIERTYHYDAFRAAIDSKGFDAIYLATPNFRHREFAVPALEAGIHVLLEKPMECSETDCRAIEAAAKASGAKLMIAYRLHFEPATLEAIRIEQSGQLGRVWLFNSVFAQPVARSNHRASHGFWAGPVPDMGTYPTNAVRNLFRAEPTEVMAHGVRHAHLGYNFDDTVSVTLRFPGDRLAQFTVSYGLNPINEYTVVGDKGDLRVKPGFGFPDGLAHQLTLGASTTSRQFKSLDQFAAETRYFSDCILHDKDPEPDAEEGRLDVRVIAAIEQALLTGKPQALAPYHRAKHPSFDQAIEIAATTPPPMVNASEPQKG
jgi:predicted dehydrogenase